MEYLKQKRIKDYNVFSLILKLIFTCKDEWARSWVLITGRQFLTTVSRL